MARRRTNNLKWTADLLKLGEIIDLKTDRVEMGYPFVRKINYATLGVTSTDKIFAERPVNEVVKKIEVRLDRDIEDNQKEYRIEIRGKKYNIERIYIKEDLRLMELSLSYAN
ncbi:hypothetical protein D1B31_16275 [Neobacillus notoginsengisoli]|uniref:Phage head-tail adapter protein n=1 Tax=Neobacillus notoginsengisoli TaxID=1578198 RepID=A0A417YRK4_9BACI|nr:hypothetical protein [Neobacillus notoginsengisoli]RHW37320.1 hypothetical protein D1B31_16275 [Neobacillus notoginsengisoli]